MLYPTKNTVMAAWAITVAAAAPATPVCSLATSTMSSTTFTTEESSTAQKGALLLPNPRRAAEYTLYTAKKGTPANTMRK